MNNPQPNPTAPSTDENRASQQTRTEPLEAVGQSGPIGKPPGDDSPGKLRFMSALLDKINLKHRASSAGVHAAEGSVISVDGSAMQDTPSGWLEATQASNDPDLPIRNMTFSYPPGSTPLPRYTIRRGIGMGGFGEVYFAVSEAGKEVALKRIQRNLEVELRGVSHCLNLKHPHLVSLFDVCRDDQGQWWVVMEYVAGPNLRQVLDASPDGLPESEVRRWFHAIAAGVNHLHSAGLVHRDLKPGNVFDDLGIIKVGDYGLSKFISASHRGGHTESVGTFHYMAPEIGRGRYGREIDIYALGILLYELMTGEVPFDGESCHEIIVKHLTATPDLSEIAEPYRAVIGRCLEKDPAKRFSSVTELLNVLEGGAPVEQLVSNSPAPVVGALVQPPVNAPAGATESSEQAQARSADHPGPPHRATGDRAYEMPASPAPKRSPDEPFARAVRHSLADLNSWWGSLDRSPGAKTFLVLVAAFVLIVNTHWLLPLLSVVAFFYVPYYVVRQMVLHARQQPTYAEAQRIASASGAVQRPVTKAQWRSHMRNDLRAKRSIHRLAELNTSWIAATLTAVGMALAAGVIGLRNTDATAVEMAPYGWMSLVVLVASLGLLGVGKLWEREDGEGLPRRLVLAGVGAGVGLATYGISDFLMMPMASVSSRLMGDSLPSALYDSSFPLPAAFMAHFALLFAGLRWWKTVDPLRRTRLSLWSVAVAVVAEWAVNLVVPIPQPSGLLIAGGIAIAVQMASPWINPRAVPNANPVQPTSGGQRSVA